MFPAVRDSSHPVFVSARRSATNPRASSVVASAQAYAAPFRSVSSFAYAALHLSSALSQSIVAMLLRHCRELQM